MYKRGFFIVVDLKKVLIVIFIILYALGLIFGCMGQVTTKNQNEMYSYLESSISNYDVPFAEGIKSIMIENLKVFAVLFIGGLFVIGPIFLAGLIFIKGYTAGFALTSVLRLFGIKGMFICTANIMSAAIILPAICWYSGMSCINIINNRYDRKLFLKKFFMLMAIMLPIVLADGFLRGSLSSLLIQIGTKW